MPIFSNKGKLYYKEFSSKDDMIDYLNEVKKEDKIYFSVARIDEITPSEDIAWLCAFVLFDYESKLSLSYFPKNWDYKKIISFLIEKINKEETEVSWEKELKEDALKFGLHSNNDFDTPYLSKRKKEY